MWKSLCASHCISIGWRCPGEVRILSANSRVCSFPSLGTSSRWAKCTWRSEEGAHLRSFSLFFSSIHGHELHPTWSFLPSVLLKYPWTRTPSHLVFLGQPLDSLHPAEVTTPSETYGEYSPCLDSDKSQGDWKVSACPASISGPSDFLSNWWFIVL